MCEAGDGLNLRPVKWETHSELQGYYLGISWLEGAPSWEYSCLWGDRLGNHQPTLVEAVIVDTIIYGETGEQEEKKGERQPSKEHQYLRGGPRGRRL